MLQDAAGLLKAALSETLAALNLTPADTAAVRLARKYADAIDADEAVLDVYGPTLLAVLEQLGATPAARAKAKGGKAPDAAPNRLAKLRDARGA